MFESNFNTIRSIIAHLINCISRTYTNKFSYSFGMMVDIDLPNCYTPRLIIRQFNPWARLSISGIKFNIDFYYDRIN